MPQWHPIIKFLHWLMTVLLIGMVGFGFAMTRLAALAEQSGDYSATLFGFSIFNAYQMHKSIGIALFGILVVRLIARWRTKPASHPDLTAFEYAVSKFVHGALYSLMFALPLSGWMLAASSPLGLPTVVFGLFELPHLVGPSVTAERVWSWLHFLGALALVVLGVVHAVAALLHHFWRRDGVLKSMLLTETQATDRETR